LPSTANARRRGRCDCSSWARTETVYAVTDLTAEHAADCSASTRPARRKIGAKSNEIPEFASGSGQAR
jgi:hypothetical protein